MRFNIKDYTRIFELEDIMNSIKYRRGCMLWMGTYSEDTTEPIYIVRFDGELISCKVLDILSAIFIDKFVNSKSKKCKTPNCVNPTHYNSG